LVTIEKGEIRYPQPAKGGGAVVADGGGAVVADGGGERRAFRGKDSAGRN